MGEKKHTLLKVATVAAASCACIHAFNKTISTNAVLKDILFHRSQLFYDWKLGRIHYTVTGKGSPVLLIHDLNPASNTNEWRYITNSLAGEHTVYCIDLLGCGCSDRPHMLYTNYVYVQLITSFIKNVIQEKTDVITSGLSGSLAVMASVNDNTIIRKILMVNPSDLADLSQVPDHKSKFIHWFLNVPVFGTLYYHILTSRSNIELSFTEKYLYNPFHTDTTIIDAFYESAHLNNSDGRYLLSSILGKYVNFNISHALKKLSNDILIVYGEGENRCKESAALYKSINPDIKYEIFSHTSHFPHIENPRYFLEILDEFL